MSDTRSRSAAGRGQRGASARSRTRQTPPARRSGTTRPTAAPRQPQRGRTTRSATTAPRAKQQKTSPAAYKVSWRLGWVLLVMLLIAGGLTYRLVDLQIRHAEEFVEIGRQQRFRSVTLAGGRGDILDRNGNTLATSLPSTSFFIDPEFVEDPFGDAARLAPVIGRPESEIRDLLGGDGRFHWLARQTSDAKAAEIAALDVAGVFSTSEPSRFHPSGSSLARSVIGNVDIDNSGLSGVETIYNDVLEGQPGELSIEIGVNGATIPGAPDLRQAAVPGADVVLTIDRSLQFEAERVLTNQIDLMDAAGGVVLVSDPRTGEILAMANIVRNDEGELISTSLNMATSWTFEPGSIMKAMSFAAVLDAGVGEPSSRLVVPDIYELFDAVFTDSTPHAPADWSIADIMTVSSNVGTIRWAERLGGDELDRYLRDFGFGEATELGFPGENGGLMIEPDRWGGIATATTALGQGMSVTPVQMLAAYNTVANGGEHVPLQIVREVVRGDESREVPAAPERRRVISAQVAREVRAMLENVVTVGTGTNAQVDGYRVAGKTGTARKALTDGRSGYEDGAGNFSYVASFAGFLPADDPQLSILVTIDQPTASIYAGHVAAPAFADIASYAVRHFRIAPPHAIEAHDGYQKPAVPERFGDRVTNEAAKADEPEPELAEIETETEADTESGPVEAVESPSDPVLPLDEAVPEPVEPEAADPAPVEADAVEAEPEPVGEATPPPGGGVPPIDPQPEAAEPQPDAVEPVQPAPIAPVAGGGGQQGGAAPTGFAELPDEGTG